MPPVDSDKTIVLEDSTRLVTSPDSATPPETFGDGNHERTRGSLAPPAPLKLDEPPQLQPLSSSPKLTISPAPPARPTPVSGDIILPLMIFAVVKTNPPRLVSHLLYTQRFRYQAVGGEESYCLINLLAVAEFLENVDLAALGLGEKENTVLRYVLSCRISISCSLLLRCVRRMVLCLCARICEARPYVAPPPPLPLSCLVTFAHRHRSTVRQNLLPSLSRVPHNLPLHAASILLCAVASNSKWTPSPGPQTKSFRAWWTPRLESCALCFLGHLTLMRVVLLRVTVTRMHRRPHRGTRVDLGLDF